MFNEPEVTDWPAGVGRIILPRVDSTMTEAARRAAEVQGPTWIMADEQTAPRGRQGRVWRSGAGNFAATLVMRPYGPPAEAALRSFVAALALHDALVSITGRADLLALKWPNDVLLAEGKCAGILLERQGDGALLIGIGVNLTSAPKRAEPDTLTPVSVVGATGVEIAPESFLTRLAAAFAAREDQFLAEGFAATRHDWLARAARLGAPMRARTGREEVAGTFDGIDPSGQLVMATAAGTRVISAADVFF